MEQKTQNTFSGRPADELKCRRTEESGKTSTRTTGKLNWLAGWRTGVFPVATRLFSSPRQSSRGNRRDGSRNWSPPAKVGIRGPMACRVPSVKRPAGCRGAAPAADSAVDAVQNKQTKRAHTHSHQSRRRATNYCCFTHTNAHAALNIRFIYVLCSFFFLLFIHCVPSHQRFCRTHTALSVSPSVDRVRTHYTPHGTRHNHFLRIPCDVSSRVAR